MLQFFTGKKNVNFFQNSQSTVFENKLSAKLRKNWNSNNLKSSTKQKIGNDTSAPQKKTKQKLFTKQK